MFNAYDQRCHNIHKTPKKKVTFRDNGHGNILGIGKVGKNCTSSIENVYLVDSLKYNLLSISQLFFKGNHVWFDDSQRSVEIPGPMTLFCMILDQIMFMW